MIKILKKLSKTSEILQEYKQQLQDYKETDEALRHNLALIDAFINNSFNTGHSPGHIPFAIQDLTKQINNVMSMIADLHSLVFTLESKVNNLEEYLNQKGVLI